MKLRKKKVKKVGIQRKMASFYADYYGTLPASEATNEDLHSAKVVIEGSMEVGWRLLKEARRSTARFWTRRGPGRTGWRVRC
jgi:hypothetical protein